jgi:hypothetical protein
MSAVSQAYTTRHGLVNEAYGMPGNWHGTESDNDGLWTSMYSAGELMRYATVRNDPNATPEEIEAARVEMERINFKHRHSYGFNEMILFEVKDGNMYFKIEEYEC